MTVSSPRLQPRPSSLTSTLSSQDWEQFNSQPNPPAVVRPCSTPIRSDYVLAKELAKDVIYDVVMHDHDVVYLALSHHGSYVNPDLYLSRFKELNRSSVFNAWYSIFVHSNRMNRFLSEYIEVHRGLRFPKEFGDVIEKYEARLDFLRNSGAEDDIELNELSKRDLFLFIDSVPYLYVASLVLTDNGNIRALWKLGEDDRVSIQFRGNGMASYVMFKRVSQGEIAREYGLTSLDGVRTTIKQIGFEEELKRWPAST